MRARTLTILLASTLASGIGYAQEHPGNENEEFSYLLTQHSQLINRLSSEKELPSIESICYTACIASHGEESNHLWAGCLRDAYTSLSHHRSVLLQLTDFVSAEEVSAPLEVVNGRMQAIEKHLDTYHEKTMKKAE